MTAPRQKLPVGIQSFASLRNDNCYYADKTGFALQLVQGSGRYLLSRPRRFGKSLFLDTLADQVPDIHRSIGRSGYPIDFTVDFFF